MLKNFNPFDRGIGHWEQRISWGRHPYWVWGRPMRKIEDELITCVFFVYLSKQDAIDNSEEGATEFFFADKQEVNPLDVRW